MLAGTVAAQPSPSQYQDTSAIQQGDVEKQGLIDQVLSVFDSLSLSTSTDQVSPGGTLTFDAEVTATENVDNVDSLVRIIEVYRCNDNSCADPNTFIEADRQFINFDASLSDGTSWAWSSTYTVPQEEGQYEAVAYLWDTDTSSIVSTTSTTQFTVGNPATPDVNIESGPSISVDRTDGSVTGRITLTNTGDGDMQGTNIVEMQVRPEDKGPLSFLSFVSTQQTCDSSYPNNVHKEFSLESGETATVTLTADQLQEGKSYDVFFLTRSGCYPDNARVEPIPNSIKAGTFNLEDGQTGSGGVGTKTLIGAVVALIGLSLGGYYFLKN